MSLSDVVVQGEAIESGNDSDVEEYSRSANGVGVRAVEHKGTVFSGEAPESDDEILAISNVKLANAQEVTETFDPSDFKPTRNNADLSLLQQCLIERNHLLWTHLNQSIQNTAAAVSSQVIATEQLLIQSQIKVQAATQKMKEASENSEQIATKLKNILSTDFLPDIRLPSNT